jgi:hypothetical protein
MGFNPFKAVKKLVKGAGKVVKGVVKGIKKVAKGIAKGVKGIAKSIGKMGPLASIALNLMFPGMGAALGTFFGNPMLGAIAKGAITGFIGSGGQLKGALYGGLAGGVMQGAGNAWEGAKTGWNASEGGLTDKISGALKGAGNSVSEGFTNAYKGAEAFINKGGDVNAANAGMEIRDNINVLEVDRSGDFSALSENNKIKLFDSGNTNEAGLGMGFSKSTLNTITDSPSFTEGLRSVDSTEALKAQMPTFAEGTSLAAEQNIGDFFPQAYGELGQGIDPFSPKVDSPYKTTKDKDKDKDTSKLGTASSLLKPDWEVPTAPTVPEIPTAKGGVGAQSGYGSSMTAEQAWATMSNPNATQAEREQASRVVATFQQSQNLQRSFG